MEEKQSRKRKWKPQKNEGGIQKKGRIIVRNLPFKTTDETLQKHFEQFGPITEINILKRPDGKLVGCGFVQFKVVQNAAKAIYSTTGKPFMGRPIICDWAQGKNTYVKNIIAAHQTEIKDEVIEIKEENNDDEVEIKTEETKEDDETSSEEEKNEDSSDSSEDEEDSDDEEDDEKIEKIETEEPRPKVISNDVTEGKTVFIKNVPFAATNDDIRECMLQFGYVYYALVCVDPVTEHSKGTAFVKFTEESYAEKCLAAGTELTLMGNILDCHKAINKNDLLNKKEGKAEKKDSRNLYLVKEGVILAGSKSAESVSASDMAKRLQLEKWKTQMLRNLNMFVSRFRIVINNLPLSYDDSKLRQLVTKYAGPNCEIKETKVMRDMKNLDNDGRGTSKEFGFVSFLNHEDALKVLRALNNNPTVFSETKRPIVSFSIENKTAINARNKRLEKSKLNNPTYNKKVAKADGKKKTWAEKRKMNNAKKTDGGTVDNEKFVGLAAKVGVNKMRSKYKLQYQSDLHHENLKKKKKQEKNKKKTIQQSKKDFIRQPQQKQNTKKKKQVETDNFSKLVNKYKTTLSTENKAKSKWYD